MKYIFQMLCGMAITLDCIFVSIFCIALAPAIPFWMVVLLVLAVLGGVGGIVYTWVAYISSRRQRRDLFPPSDNSSDASDSL